MGRRLRNTLPASKELLRPGTHDTQKVKRHSDEQKAKQKFYYDHRRGVKELPPLDKGAPVHISPLPGTNNWLPGKVATHYNKPRSYVVQAGNRLYRRNWKHLRVSTELANATRDDEDTDLHVDTPPPDPLHGAEYSTQANTSTQFPKQETSTSRYVTRSGRRVVAPQKLDL